MGPKLSPKLILEGTRLTQKTELAFALNEHPRLVGARKYRYHSPVISAEWGTFDETPWGTGPINFRPEQEARALEVYATWARMFELQPHTSWIVDRFHLATRAYQLVNRGRDVDFGWLEDRLLPLGFHGVFCWRRPDTFAAAREKRLLVSGNPRQYDDVSVFVREQELFERLVAQSKLPWLKLDVTDGDLGQACNRIADWLEQTGGLWGRPAGVAAPRSPR